MSFILPKNPTLELSAVFGALRSGVFLLHQALHVAKGTLRRIGTRADSLLHGLLVVLRSGGVSSVQRLHDVLDWVG
jgi:hypothetical protein